MYTNAEAVSPDDEREGQYVQLLVQPDGHITNMGVWHSLSQVRAEATDDLEGWGSYYLPIMAKPVTWETLEPEEGGQVRLRGTVEGYDGYLLVLESVIY